MIPHLSNHGFVQLREKVAEGKATQVDDESDRRRAVIAPTGQIGPARRRPIAGSSCGEDLRPASESAVPLILLDAHATSLPRFFESEDFFLQLVVLHGYGDNDMEVVCEDLEL